VAQWAILPTPISHLKEEIYMRIHSWVAVALVALLSSAVASSSYATIVFSNFGTGLSFPDSGRILQGPLVGNIADVDQAASFINGPFATVVTDVKLGIYVDSPTNSPFDGRGPLDIIIASDAAGLPGAALHTTSLNPNTYLTQIADAPIGATVTLAANTKYWIIADAKGTFDGAWEYNPINDFGPVAGRSNNGPWDLQNANDPRLVFQVEGRTIPEPATATILGIGLAASLCLRRTRIRRHA
jgi:hypothetical protein